MHRFSPFCPMSIDGNITRMILWTEKAALLPNITYFHCGATSAGRLKCWVTFDSPSPIISGKFLCSPAALNAHSRQVLGPVSCPGAQNLCKALQEMPGGMSSPRQPSPAMEPQPPHSSISASPVLSIIYILI